MKLVLFTERPLSSEANDLIQFDMDSIRQIVAARHGEAPELWLADPDQYERNGRILRDSTSPRLLACCSEGKTLYVTDGCNSCTHELKASLMSLSASQLQGLAEESGIRIELLEKLAVLAP
jgi:hypothetical protein